MSRFDEAVEFNAVATFNNTVYLPAETVTNSSFSASSQHRLSANKVVHRVDLLYSQSNSADVTSDTKVLRIARGSGTLKAVKVRPTTAPTGGDKQFTVDVQKAADASGSWTSLLSSAVTVSSSSANNTLQTATLASAPTTTVAADSAIRIVVTASGSTGSQGQGVVVAIYYEEAPE